jgi:hypothetical protein
MESVDAMEDSAGGHATVCGSEGVADTQQAIARNVDREGLPAAFIGGKDQMAIAAFV